MRPFIRNASGGKIVANERVGMGTARGTYFREEVAKPSQVIVAASNPETLKQLAKAKRDLVQDQLNGAWIAIGAMILGGVIGGLLAYIGAELPSLLLGTVVMIGVVALSAVILFIDMRISVLTAILGLAGLLVLANGDGIALQAVAFAVLACFVSIPKWLPIIHGAAHADRFSKSVTNLLYELEGALHTDLSGDNIIGSPQARPDAFSVPPLRGNAQDEFQRLLTANQSRQIPIVVNGETIDRGAPVPHVTTYQVLEHPFDTTRNKGLYTPQQARDFYMLVTTSPQYMDRNNIYGKGLAVGTPPRRIQLTKQVHDDLKAGLYAIGAIKRIGPKYVVSGKTRREVEQLLSTVAKSISEEIEL
jgi:hypothetical protein